MLLPLCERDGVPCVLFTVRTDSVGTHKGQVSFPGGMMDAGESPEQAARREALEEIGGGLGPLAMLGQRRHAISSETHQLSL